MDTFLSKVLGFLRGEIDQLKAEATAFEQKLLPGADAIAKKALKTFGDNAIQILEQAGRALISGLAAGGNVGVIIPQLVSDAVKDLAPEFITDAKNVLYSILNLALADATESGTIVLPIPAPVTPPTPAAGEQAVSQS